jgi:hypothetical protein
MEIAVETCVRIVMLLLSLLIVGYYVYLLALSWLFIKRSRQDSSDENERYALFLKRKRVPTVCHAISMAAVGTLYLIGTDLLIMTYMLILLSVIVAFVGDKWILSLADMKKRE